MPLAEIVDEPPISTVDGLAEQLTVGGSNGLTVKSAEQSAIWPGFEPSET